MWVGSPSVSRCWYGQEWTSQVEEAIGQLGRALRVIVVLRGLLVGVVLYVVLLGLHVAVRLVLVGARVDRSLHCLVRCWVGMIPRCDVPGGIRAVFV